MNAPPAVCSNPKCGWVGPAPGFHIENSTDITFEGGSTSCPVCGSRANIVSGTYDFIGGIVRLVRDANLSYRDVLDLRQAAERARQTGKAPEEFAAENPAVAPIINVLVQQRSGRDWLVIFLMLLTILVPYIQSREYHADEQRQQHAQPPATTLILSDRDVEKIANQVERRLERSGTPPRAPKKATVKRKRPPKQHGKNKNRKKRHR